MVGDQYVVDAPYPSNNAPNLIANPYLRTNSGSPLKPDNDIQDHDDGWCLYVLYTFQIIHCSSFWIKCGSYNVDWTLHLGGNGMDVDECIEGQSSKFDNDDGDSSKKTSDTTISLKDIN